MAEWVSVNKFFDCETRVIEGEAGLSIARFIDKKREDLTVLGTSARRRLSRVLLGSVAEEIFRDAGSPFLVLGPKTRPTTRCQLKRLVFATDLEPHSIAMFPRLSNLARAFGSTITVVRAIRPGIRPLPERTRIERETKLEVKQAADPELRKRIKEIQVKFGDPLKVVTAATNAGKADAIVMGIRSGGAWGRAITHVPWALAHRVIADAKCPVLTIRS